MLLIFIWCWSDVAQCSYDIAQCSYGVAQSSYDIATKFYSLVTKVQFCHPYLKVKRVVITKPITPW
jgi:hypothetical protein